MTEENQEFQWFILQTYSGHENKVKEVVERVVEKRGLKRYFKQLKIPMMEVTQLKDGKKQIKKRKIMPGYVLVEMIPHEELIYTIRRLPSVAGFIGGKEPKPLTEEELRNIFIEMGEMVQSEEEKQQKKIDFQIGDRVRIIDGPFLNYVGEVDEIYPDRGRLRIKVEIFGGKTPVEIDHLQVRKE